MEELTYEQKLQAKRQRAVELQRSRRQKIRDGTYQFRKQYLPEITEFTIRQRYLAEGYEFSDDPLAFTPLQPAVPTEYRSNLLNYINAELTHKEVIGELHFYMNTEAAELLLTQEGVYFPI